MSVNYLERAYYIWEILIQLAQTGSKITYGDLSKKLDVTHYPLNWSLEAIQEYCFEERLPPLTLLVITPQKKQPVVGFKAWNIDNNEDGFEKVCQFNWSQQPNPFEFAVDGTQYDQLIERLIAAPDESEAVYNQVKTRNLLQRMFRDALLTIYHHQCAFSGIVFENTLEATHIMPWSICDIKDRINIRNGILLSNFHRQLFDQGLMTLKEDYTIYYYDYLEEDNPPYSQLERLLTIELHGKQMTLPAQKNHWPNPELIQRHNHKWVWKFK